MPSDGERALVVIGMMASGKTTTGRLLAEKLGWAFLDNDEEIERRCGQRPADLLRSDAQRFRDMEADIIAEILERGGKLVFSIGGGAIERDVTQQQLRDHAVVVWLRAPIDVLLRRVAAEQEERPMLDGDPAERMKALLHRRTPMYESLAHYTVDVGDIDVEGAALRVIEALS